MEGFVGYNCRLSYYLPISVYELEEIVARKEIHYQFQYLEIKIGWFGDYEKWMQLILGIPQISGTHPSSSRAWISRSPFHRR
jgi:hypothetical protein